MGLLFKRRRKGAEQPAAQASALPPSVEAALDGVSVMDRGFDGDGLPRVMVMFPGETTASWHHSKDETRSRLAAWWPDLNAEQLDRACRAIAGKVRQAQAEGEHAPRRRRNFALDW